MACVRVWSVLNGACLPECCCERIPITRKSALAEPSCLAVRNGGRRAWMDGWGENEDTQYGDGWRVYACV